MDHLGTLNTEQQVGARELAQLLAHSGVQGAELALHALGAVQGMGIVLTIKSIDSGRYVFASEGAAQLFECPVEHLIGRGDSELLGEDGASDMRKAELAVLGQRVPILSDHKLDRASGRREFSVYRLLVGNDLLCATWAERTRERQLEDQAKRALEQLGQQQAANEQVRREFQQGSGHDPTTGLFLRSQFEDQLRREVDLSTREHRQFALVLMALDPLDQEGLGPAARQSQLEALGRLLHGNTRAMDAACRVADEKFAILLSGVGLATAHARMEQLRRQCAAQIVVYEGGDLGMSVSIGVASFPHSAASKEALMQSSEAALMDAKRRGGNLVTLATISFEPG